MAELTVQQKQLGTIAAMFNNKKMELAKVLPKHCTPERFIKVALQAAARNQTLLACKADSLYSALICASELGLEPGGPLARAHMVPFRNNGGGMDCVLIPDYRGLIELAIRSGKVLDIDAHVVREGDEFEFQYGAERKLKHVPKSNEDAPMTHAYACAYLKDNVFHFVVLTKTQVDYYRRKSRAKDDGPWVTDYEAMAVKTAIRRLCNLLPQSVELSKAIAMDTAAETGERYVPEILDVTPTEVEPLPALPEKQTRTEALKEKMSAKAATAAAPKPEPENKPVAKAAEDQKKETDSIIEKIMAAIEDMSESEIVALENYHATKLDVNELKSVPLNDLRTIAKNVEAKKTK